MPSGILVIDKPAGPTSFEVVKRVRRMLRADKAGHAGTLDPAATGVLAVCVDEAVKLQQWLTEGDKGYEAEVAFGAATATEDAEGEVVARGDPSAASEAAIRAAAAFLQREVARKLRLRHPPHLRFVYDESVARGDRIERLLKEAKAKDAAAGSEKDSGSSTD